MDGHFKAWSLEMILDLDREPGYFLIWRRLLSSPVWTCSTSNQKVILIVILSKANHVAKKWEWGGKEFSVMPGQFVTSVESLRKAAGVKVSRQNVRTALQHLKHLGFLTIESTSHGTLITIINWDAYQVANRDGNLASNKRVTNGSPTGNQRVTTTKNEKNEKNEKKKEKINKKEKIVIPVWLDKEIWGEFKKYRQNGKNKFTDHAQKLSITSLEKLRETGNDPNKVIEQSIQRGWSGLFPLKKDSANKEETAEEFLAKRAQRRAKNGSGDK